MSKLTKVIKRQLKLKQQTHDELVAMRSELTRVIGELETETRALQRLNRRVDGYSQVLQYLLWNMQRQGEGESLESLEETKKRVFSEMSPASGQIRKIQLALNVLLKKLDETCREHNLTYWIDYGTLLGAVRHKGNIPWDDDADVSMMRADAEKLIEILKDDPLIEAAELYLHTPTGSFNHNVQLKFKKTDNIISTPYSVDIFIRDYAPNHKQHENAFKTLDRLKKQHRKEAAEIWKKLEVEGYKEHDPYVVSTMKEHFDQCLAKAYKEAGLSREGGNSVIWGFDNMMSLAYIKQGNYACEDIFPLIELEFNGMMLYAPKNWQTSLENKYKDWYSIPVDIVSHQHFNLSQTDMETLDYIVENCI